MELLSMAYRRRYKKRSRRSYKKKKQTGGMSIGDMAVAGFKMAKKLVRLVNVEQKHYTATTSVQSNYDGDIVDLCDPAQGHDQDERNGDSIKPLRLTIRGQVYSDASGASTQYIRVILFRYKDENGVTLQADDILDPNYTGGGNVIFAPKNWDKRFHSKIIYDKIFRLGNYLGTSAGQDPNLPVTIPFKIVKKLYGHINWSDSTSTEEGGGLYMLVCSQAASDADAPVVSFVSRVTFTDN